MSMFSSNLSMLVDYWPAIQVDGVQQRDQAQYALCASLWVGLVYDCSNASISADLQSAINAYGLYSCIRSADLTAKAVLAEEDLDFSGLSLLWSKIILNCHVVTDDGSFNPSEWTAPSPLVDPLPFAHVSPERVREAYACQLILRFPKRFTVCKPDTEEAMRSFISVAKEDRKLAHCTWRWPGQCIIDHVRVVMRQILIPKGKRTLSKIVRDYSRSRGSFSSGSAFYPGYCTNKHGDCTSKLPAAKLGYWAYVVGRCYYYEYPLADTLTRGPLRDPNKYCARVMAVPKDYETSRMIAPETPYLNYEASRVLRLLLDLTEATGALHYMDPLDQSNNRKAARLGSLLSWSGSGDVPATIDLSHASDSIVRQMFFAVLPHELHSVVRHALSDYIITDESSGRMETPMLSTSGSVLNNILQSSFYLALCWTACDLAGCSRDAVLVYNDDIVVNESVFQTVVEMLTLWGLTVNEKKTFHGSNPFRESCGGEYVYGLDVTGKYWPRKAIKLNLADMTRCGAESLQTLIAMQHRLYDFPSVRLCLESVIKAIVPDMTYSPVNADCEDLWGVFVDDYTSMTKPHYKTCSTWKDVSIDTKNLVDFSTIATLGRKAMEREAYFSFLEHGPRYASALDELLGVSEANDYHKHAMQVSSSTFKMSKPVIRKDW